MSSSNLIAVSTLVPSVLCSVQILTTGNTTVYTVPANSGAVIKHGVLCNTSNAAVVITGVSVVPSGGTTDGTHRVISGYSLTAYDSLSLKDYLGGACLGPGDSIVVQVATANAIDIVLTGMVNS